MVDMRRNVGTAGAPESYLHARTVALLYDEITRRGTEDTGVWIRTSPGGAYDVDIRAGVARTKIPGEWDSVGGIVPDLIMYGDDDTPVRIVEVVVTSPPTAQKRACLDRLVKRGVDVVEVHVRTEEDMLWLCRRVGDIGFRVSDKKDGGVGVSSQYYKGRAREYDPPSRGVAPGVDQLFTRYAQSVGGDHEAARDYGVLVPATC